MEMKAILIKSFLLIEVVLFWTVILPVAALFCVGRRYPKEDVVVEDAKVLRYR